MFTLLHCLINPLECVWSKHTKLSWVEVQVHFVETTDKHADMQMKREEERIKLCTQNVKRTTS